MRIETPIATGLPGGGQEGFASDWYPGSGGAVSFNLGLSEIREAAETAEGSARISDRP